LLSVSYLVRLLPATREVSADRQLTRKTHSTSTIFGSLPPQPRTLRYLMTRTTIKMILLQRNCLTARPHSLHLESRPSHPILRASAESTASESSVATPSVSQVDDSLELGDSALRPVMSPLFSVIPVYTILRPSTLVKMRMTHSLELPNPKGGLLPWVG
jgi:hypothetical protein